MGICIQWNTKQWLKGSNQGPPLVAQWLGICLCNTGDLSSSPGQGTEILHACVEQLKLWCHTEKVLYDVMMPNK